jgi:hypothetical protein
MDTESVPADYVISQLVGGLVAGPAGVVSHGHMKPAPAPHPLSTMAGEGLG